MSTVATQHRNPSRWTLAGAALLASQLLPGGAIAEVESETIYFIQPDGRGYLLERALRTDASAHRFHVEKSVTRDDLRHVDPQRFEWDDRSNPDANLMSFDSGGFTVIFPGRFAAGQISTGDDGETIYRSWDGTTDTRGRFGIWYAPGDFDRFTYTWILPDNIELLAYTSNRDGEWVRRGSAVSFYARDVNNLTFEMRYRVAPTDGAPTRAAPDVTVAPVAPAPPAAAVAAVAAVAPVALAAAPAAVAPAAPAAPRVTTGRMAYDAATVSADSDADGVPDGRDLCRATPRGAKTDRAGCSLDSDKDGIADGIDACIATPDGTDVDARGCAITTN